MNIKLLSWHDSVIESIAFKANYKKKSKLIIYLSLYPEQIHSSDRNPIKIICTDIEWYKSDLNMKDLEENESAGNIYHGEMLGPVLRIELFGGDILVKAAKYKVVMRK